MKAWYFFLIGAIVTAQTVPKQNADSLYQLGNYAAAINVYSQNPDDKAMLQIARAYTALGNEEKAIAQYKSSLEVNPLNILARFELGKLYDRTKQHEEAFLQFLFLTKEGSSNPEFYYYLGKTEQAREQYKSGALALKKAIQLDPRHLGSAFLLGKYYVGTKERDSTLKYVNLGLQSYANDVGLINLKALAYFDAGDYSSAAPQFEQLLDLGEEKVFILEKLAYSYSNLGELERAKSIYFELLDRKEAKGKVYYDIAHVYWREKALDSADYYLKASIAAQQPVLSQEYSALGRLAKERSDLKSSLEYYTLAFEENPDDYIMYYQVCVTADQYYEDPNLKLSYYEKLLQLAGNTSNYFTEFARKRISELKEEIHFARN